MRFESLVLWGFKYQTQYMSVFKSAILDLKVIKHFFVAILAIWLLVLKNMFKSLPVSECAFGM